MLATNFTVEVILPTFDVYTPCCYTHARTHKCIHTTHACTHKHARAYTLTHMHTHTCTPHTYTYHTAHTHTHTHTQKHTQKDTILNNYTSYCQKPLA